MAGLAVCNPGRQFERRWSCGEWSRWERRAGGRGDEAYRWGRGGREIRLCGLSCKDWSCASGGGVEIEKVGEERVWMRGEEVVEASRGEGLD